MTVGFYSPLPPARTGVADYAAALLAELRRHGRVEVAPRGATWRSITWATTGCTRRSIAAPWSGPGWWCCTTPCCTIFCWGSSTKRAYVDEFVYNYGEWNRGLARELWRGAGRRPAPTAATSSIPCCGAWRSGRWRWWCTIRRRRGAVQRSIAPGARVVEIPHLFPAPATACHGRERAALPPGAGRRAGRVPVRRVRLPARIQAPGHRAGGVRARCAARSRAPALLVAGQFVSTDLERAVAPLLPAPGVLPPGRFLTGEREFWLAARSRGCLHQSALSGGGRDFGHRHPADGHRQAGAGDGFAASARAFPKTPACGSRRGWRNANRCGST